MASQIFVKESLVFALLQHEHEGVRTQALSDVGEIDFAAHFAAREQTRPSGNRAQFDGFLS